MRNSTFLTEVSDQNGVSVERLTAALKITRHEMAKVAGLWLGTVSNASDVRSVASSARLHEMCLIIDKAIPWAGSACAAYAWYRSQSLPSFGDATAEELVRQGHGDNVYAYLGRLEDGGYA